MAPNTNAPRPPDTTSLDFNFEGVDSWDGSAFALPEPGPYKAKINDARVVDGKRGGGRNIEVEFDLGDGDSQRGWFALPQGTGDKKDKGRIGRQKSLWGAVGLSKEKLAGRVTGLTPRHLVGKSLVVYLKPGTYDKTDDSSGEVTTNESRDVIPVAPENAADCLAGRWAPRGCDLIAEGGKRMDGAAAGKGHGAAGKGAASKDAGSNGASDGSGDFDFDGFGA